METLVTYKLADNQQDYEIGRKLFEEYADSLNVDLSFQNFSNELDYMGQRYHAPEGGLLLAFHEQQSVGCAGVRKWDDTVAELKRMYVKDGFRGYKIGVSLLQHAITLAKELGYKKIRLDTLKNMTKAQELYRSFGFREIPAYTFNPLEGTIYMEKDLKAIEENSVSNVAEL